MVEQGPAKYWSPTGISRTLRASLTGFGLLVKDWHILASRSGKATWRAFLCAKTERDLKLFSWRAGWLAGDPPQETRRAGQEGRSPRG